jgi:cytochrome c2
MSQTLFSCIGLALLLLAIPTHADADSPSPAPLDRPLNYTLHCEGCHRADGSGQKDVVPTFVDQISAYAHVPEGRNFLIQVPGVSQTALNDKEVAELMNWLLPAYDAKGLPDDFKPYTEDEVRALRRQPISDTIRQRQAVHEKMDANAKYVVAAETPKLSTPPVQVAVATEKEHKSTEPPKAFMLCSACHTTSADGANSMGPNLRGVMGRKSGAVDGFGYSKAMRTSNIVWSKHELDRFLQSPRKTVPNTTMSYAGERDAAKRRVIIEYLETLKKVPTS